MRKKNYLQKVLIFLLMYYFIINANAQYILNGSFEENTATVDTLDLCANCFNATVPHCFSIGLGGNNLDLITSEQWCNIGAQEGKWYIGLTSKECDAVALELSEPLHIGTSYQLSFYDKFCLFISSAVSLPVEIGLSNNCNSFDTSIYISPVAPTNVWTQRVFTFTAPITAQCIAVRLSQNYDYHVWNQIDNFMLTSLVNEKPIEQQECMVNLHQCNAGITIYGNDLQLLRVYSSNGALLHTEAYPAGTTTANVSLHNLNAGFYIAEIQNKGQKIFKKFVK